MAFLVHTPFEVSSLNSMEVKYALKPKIDSKPKITFQHQVHRKSLHKIFLKTIGFDRQVFVDHITHLHVEFSKTLKEAQIMDLSLFKNLKYLAVIGSVARFRSYIWTRMDKLETLRLINNKMKFLTFLCPNLIKLECDDRQLSVMSIEDSAEFAGKLDKLTKLKLDGRISFYSMNVISSIFPNLKNLHIVETCIESLSELVAIQSLTKITCRLLISPLRLRYLFEEVQKEFLNATRKLHNKFNLHSFPFFVNGFRITQDARNLDEFFKYLKQDEQLSSAICDTDATTSKMRKHKLRNCEAIVVNTLQNQSASVYKFPQATREVDIQGSIDGQFLSQIPTVWPFLQSLALLPSGTEHINTQEGLLDLQFLAELPFLQRIRLEQNVYDFSGLIQAIRTRPQLTEIVIYSNTNLDRSTLKRIHECVEKQAKRNPTLHYTLIAPKVTSRSHRRLLNLSLY
jgi:sRNA-binding regulator protein Hfq